MTIDAVARLTMNTGEVRVIEFVLTLPYKMGECGLAIERAGIDKKDVREARITY
jgi:hypothetical protein